MNLTMQSQRQTTIANPIEFDGVGLHTGAVCSLRILPSGPGEGVVFAHRGRRVRAGAESAVQAARNTVVSDGVISLHTIEHVMSALYCMGIDNAEIEMSADEPPALDGGAEPYAAGIRRAGLKELDATREYLTIAKKTTIEKGRSRVTAEPFDGFVVEYEMEYEHPMIGIQSARFEGGADEYLREIAPARTFGLSEEVEALRAAGLALGGSEFNAVVVYPDSYSSPLRFDNEFARHKLLDLTGDLALAGRRLRGRFKGERSGHALNVELVRLICSAR
ncbi:MAG TPA: UDP-3-O-acyl-N-acetylglucosamine deacetylase [bacterium]|nr:UDP-3-O-acyl-N-acetylglucosamine deacetylase [bacterium]